MRTFAPLILRFLFAAVVMNCGAFAPMAFAQVKATKSVWMNDLSRAVKLAKTKNRLMLVHFYADWCGPCKSMQRETLGSRSLANQLAGKIVAVKINSDNHPDLVKKYQIRALPSDLFISPSGRILSRVEGYQTQRQYLSLVARMDALFDNTEKVRIAKSKPTKKATKTDRPPKRIDGGSPVRRIIGMDGFSPVALHENRQWRTGKPKFAWKYQDVTFWMADAIELATFKSDPWKYAPRLLGCDPVVLNETDRAIPGKLDYGAFFDGHLYFFASDASRKKFRANPLPYTRTRHVLRVDHIGGSVRR